MYHYSYNNEQEDNRNKAAYHNSSNSNSNHMSLFSQPLNHTTTLDELPSQFLDNQYDANALLNDSLFDFNHHQWDYLTQPTPPPLPQQQQQQQQEAILLSDPNFLRQHQLLQDQQREMQIRLQDENTGKEQVSNLTAMLEPKKVPTMPLPKPQKRNSKRQIVKSEPADDTKIDHQRRFNELQARFRVNYARKPSTQMTSKSTQKTTKTQPAPSPVIAHRKSPSPVNSCHDGSKSPTIKLEPIKSPLLPPSNVNNKQEEPTIDKLSSSFPSRTMPIQIQRMSRPNSSQPFDAESHQRLLDSQLDKVDFDDITVSELKEMLRQRGKPATGKKAVLLQRLQEEREIAKGGRSPGGRTNNNHRHSQPLPFSRPSQPVDPPLRPRSFQGSSPVTIQQSHGQDTLLPPGSPGGQLHRSIANMHIGSPPTTSRRYSPYSPRLSSSPKTSGHVYSSSMPLSSGDLSSSPHQPVRAPAPPPPPPPKTNHGMMLSSSYSIAAKQPTATPGRYYNNPKTYKPFTSSALATPDREEDINPFDRYYASQDAAIEEEEQADTNPMDWTDPAALDLLLQQGTINMNVAEMLGQPLYSDDVVLTNEQIMALLNSQQQAPPFEFKIEDNSNFNTYYQQHD